MMDPFADPPSLTPHFLFHFHSPPPPTHTKDLSIATKPKPMPDPHPFAFNLARRLTRSNADDLMREFGGKWALSESFSLLSLSLSLARILIPHLFSRHSSSSSPSFPLLPKMKKKIRPSC